MLSFDQLIYDVEMANPEDVKEYLNVFFVSTNYTDYLIDEKAQTEDKMSIKELFDGKEDILVRAININQNNPFCIEAFFVNYCLNEETVLNILMNNMFHKSGEYETFSEYQKMCYLRILNFYVQYLINIHNVTFAIKVLKKVIELQKESTDVDIARLSYLYCLIENKDDFYDLYLNVGFNQIAPYLLLIVVLLKHEDELKAKEVYSEMLSKFEYATFIDHVWDLEDVDDEEAVDFKNTIEACFEEICAIPYFFSWCSDNKEKVLRS